MTSVFRLQGPVLIFGSSLADKRARDRPEWGGGRWAGERGEKSRGKAIGPRLRPSVMSLFSFQL